MNNKKIGATISNLRKSKGLTQKQLSETIYVSQKAISKWETGDGVPDLTNLVELSKIFNVSSDYILQGLGSEGVENLNSSHKRFNLVYEMDFDNIESEEVANDAINKQKKEDVLEEEKVLEEEIKNEEDENAEDEKQENASSKTQEKSKKRSADDILKLVENVGKKAGAVAGDTYNLANNASKERGKVPVGNNNAKNQVVTKTKKPYYALFINIGLLFIALSIILPNLRSNGFATISYFSGYIIFLVSVTSIVLSVMCLADKKVSKKMKTFSIINIITTVLIAIITYIYTFIIFLNFMWYM